MGFHGTKKNNGYHSHTVIWTCLGGRFFPDTVYIQQITQRYIPFVTDNDINFVNSSVTLNAVADLEIGCNTIRQKSLTWTRKLNTQLNLAYVARKNI